MKKCLFWIDDIDCLLLDQKVPESIGGANVQLSFWSRIFAENGWSVYSFTHKLRNRNALDKVSFLYIPLIRKTMFVLAYLKYLHLIILKPDLVITRANPGGLKLLLYLQKKYKFKLLHTIASDFDVETDTTAFSKLENYLISADLVIAQNTYQKEACRKKLNIETIVIPNIWDLEFFLENNKQAIETDALWIANFRSLKRPELFLYLAKRNPKYKFAMIGNSLEPKCYNESKKTADLLPNVSFLGYKSLQEVDALLRSTKVLICTSEIEGFPNTFLHAWSHCKPVLSTVDPSLVITTNDLGFYSSDIDEINLNFKNMMLNKSDYKRKCDSIEKYFKLNHNPQASYDKLIQFFSYAQK